MAPHSSTLAWKIPWTEEPGGLQSMGSLRVNTTERLHFHFPLSFFGGGNGNPLQYSCLENPRDGGAWWAAALYRVTQSWTWLKQLSNSSSRVWQKYLTYKCRWLYQRKLPLHSYIKCKHSTHTDIDINPSIESLPLHSLLALLTWITSSRNNHLLLLMIVTEYKYNDHQNPPCYNNWRTKWIRLLKDRYSKFEDFFGRNDAKAETPVLWPPHAKSWLIGKDSDAGRDWGKEEKGTTEDEMAGWHHWLDGCESQWTPGDGDGQGGLACCDSWGRKESDMTERLIWSDLINFA